MFPCLSSKGWGVLLPLKWSTVPTRLKQNFPWSFFMEQSFLLVWSGPLLWRWGSIASEIIWEKINILWIWLLQVLFPGKRHKIYDGWQKTHYSTSVKKITTWLWLLGFSVSTKRQKQIPHMVSKSRNPVKYKALHQYLRHDTLRLRSVRHFENHFCALSLPGQRYFY